MKDPSRDLNDRRQPVDQTPGDLEEKFYPFFVLSWQKRGAILFPVASFSFPLHPVEEGLIKFESPWAGG